MIKLLRWSIRIAGLAALVLGLLIWSGRLGGAVYVHMTLGWVVAAGLVIIAVYGLVSGVRIPLAVVSIAWAAATVYVGVMQNQSTSYMPRSSHLVIEALHLLLGIGAIGMAEALAGAITRGRKSLA
jgi:hypothetical protein